MFEHSLYEPEPVVTPTQEGDLFHNYEIRNWELSNRIYKILGVSALVNLLALFVFSTTSVLTMKGCESPLVGNVCQVLDTIYVGSKLFGTEREMVDAVYEKTDLGEADVTFVDVSGDVPPLSYPEGYFQIANPEQFQAMVEQANNPTTQPGFIAPGIPITTPSTGASIIDTPQSLPKTNPNPIAGDLPSGFGDSGSNPTIRKGRRDGRVKPPVPDEDDTADKQDEDKKGETPKVEPTDPVTAVTINREPMKKFGKETAEKVDKKEVDLSSNFKVVAQATLTADGKLDTTIDKKTKQKKSRILQSEGDEKMIAVVTEAIAAIGDSGWLGYLKAQGIDKLNFTFSQTDDQLIVNITSDQLTPERVKTISSGLGGLISTALLADRMGANTLGTDEKALLQAAKVTDNNKQVMLDFVLPKPVAQEMINRNIQKSKEAETGKKSQRFEPAANTSVGLK